MDLEMYSRAWLAFQSHIARGFVGMGSEGIREGSRLDSTPARPEHNNSYTAGVEYYTSYVSTAPLLPLPRKRTFTYTYFSALYSSVGKNKYRAKSLPPSLDQTVQYRLGLRGRASRGAKYPNRGRGSRHTRSISPSHPTKHVSLLRHANTTA